MPLSRDSSSSHPVSYTHLDVYKRQSQYSAEQPFDDFAKAPALQSIEPLAKLEYSAELWEKALEKSTDLYRSDPKIQSLWARATFRSVNEYFVNTEGTITCLLYTSRCV